MPNKALGIFFACLLVVGYTAPIADNTSALAGRWKNVSGTFHFSDGTTNSNPAQVKCWIEFFESRAISECTTSRGTDRIVYAYRLVDTGKYESEVLENKNFPSLVGTRVTTDFRIEDGKLFTSAYPPPPKVNSPKYPVRVEATWIRD